MPLRIVVCLTLLSLLLLLACGSGQVAPPNYGPCADLGILDPDELDLERQPLWLVADLDEARRLPASVTGVRLVGATDLIMAELAAKTAITEVVFDASPMLSFNGIEELQALPNLEILDCQGLDLQDTWMDEIVLIPALRELYLRDQQSLTQIGFAHLANTSALKELYLEGVPLIDQWMDEIAATPNLERLIIPGAVQLTENAAIEIAKIASLKRLDLSQCGVMNDWLLRLAQAPSQQLEELTLSGNAGFTQQGLAHLRNISSLRELDISGCAVNAAWLPELGQLTSLVELRMNGLPLVAVQFWAELINLTNLETLEVAASSISDNHLLHLVGIPKLRKLDLSQNPVGDIGMARLRASTTLVQLFLDGNYALSNTALTYLSQIATLRELRFGIAGAGEYGFSNQGMRRISEMPAIQDLTLARCNGFSDADMELLKHLTPSLRRLTLIECDNISGIFATYLASAGSCLNRLSVLDCPGVQASGLYELDRLRNLERLAIPNAANNELARSLAEMPSLKRLDISGSPVDDIGLRYFDTSLNLEAMQCVGCPITTAAIEEFHAANPAIIIR